MPYCSNCGNQLQEADKFCETCGTARKEASSKTSFTGKTCPFCQFPIKQDSETVLCTSCKIPHHRECWEENGGCTTFGCRGLSSGQASSSYRNSDILEIELDHPEQLSTSNGALGGKPGVLRSDEKCSAGGRIKGSKLKKFVKYAAGLLLLFVLFELILYAYAVNVHEGNRGTYTIDMDDGTIPVGDLPIGARVIDPSWEWEFRTGRDYTREEGDQTKPVTWIVVAKDHYEGLDPHVTLLSEELIGRFSFDDSTDRGNRWGSNSWGDSGTGNATSGLRPWLNSTGLHAGEGFYRTFSEDFKRAVLTTTVPNKEWVDGSAYRTSDKVFVPTSTELGDIFHIYTYRVGTVFSYFRFVRMGIFSGMESRTGFLGDRAGWYWTRSPDSLNSSLVCGVGSAGAFNGLYVSDRIATLDNGAVRPALNLKSEILVSEINP